MNSVFFETSALIDWVFGDSQRKIAIKNALPPKIPFCTSRLVLFELGLGFLNNLILLHNKCLQVGGFNELLGYANASRLAPHRMATVIGALDQFLRSSNAYPAYSNEEQLSLAKGYLRQLIRRGWRKAHSDEFTKLNQVKCRDDLPSPFQCRDGYFEHHLPKKKCGDLTNCGLKQHYQRNVGDFKRIRHKISPPIDHETDRRITAMKSLIEHPKQSFTLPVCRSCADATLAHECPHDSLLITKNKKHIEPILQVLSKQGVYY